MPTVLLKTEPETYSFDDLKRDGSTVWDGITNNAALKFLRETRKGDTAFIYHTGDEKRIVGLATITSAAYEDPKNPGVTKAGGPKFAVVDLKAGKPVKTPLTLDDIKTDKRFAGFELLRQPRLSVVPVPAEIEKIIRELTGA